MGKRFLSGPIARLVVAGDSMLPTYRAGDWLVATKVNRLAPGQVVVIERENRPGLLIIKRIVRAQGEKWWVEGDNPLASNDSRTFGPIESSEILGRIRFRYRRA